MDPAPLPHPGEPFTPHDLWGAWNLEPAILISLALAVVIYGLGVRTLWQRAGVGRGVRRSGVMNFGIAVLALLAALVSPLDALSGALFAAHMTQHLVLMLVAAPLLVLSDYGLALLWALPRRTAQVLGQRVNRLTGLRGAWAVLSSPASAWLAFTVTMWAWHLPALYEAALRSEAMHALEHGVFLATAMLFWSVLVRHARPDRVRYGIAIPYLFTAALQSGILGALMTFTTRPWYPYYATLTPAWGLTPLQDQQLAGLIMWAPVGALFTILTIAYFAAWLRSLEQRAVS